MGNYGEYSRSLENVTSDRPSDLSGESDNWGADSISLNNGIDVDPNENFGPGSISLSNINGEIDASNPYPGSDSLNNGIDEDPTGNVYE